MEKIRSHFDLQVHQFARSAAIKVSTIVNILPSDERFDMGQQWRRSSRSVCNNIAQAWRKRRYPAAFVAKLSDAEAEAAESQTWADLAEGARYISKDARNQIVAEYEVVLGQLVTMVRNAAKWTVSDSTKSPPVSQAPCPFVT